MGNSPFLNAFRLLAKKPVLFLLLLPLQLAAPLVGRLMPMPDYSAEFETYAERLVAQNVFGALFQVLGILGLVFILYLLAGFFLVPPAMELLHDGARGEESPARWYGRGLGRHWWKPVALGAMEVGIFVVLIILFEIVISLFSVIAISGAALSSLRYQDDGGVVSSISALGVILIPTVIMALVCMLIFAFFALLLPATADRGFGAAFKALFTGYGFKKVMKVFGVYLLTMVVSALIYLLVFLTYAVVANAEGWGWKYSLGDMWPDFVSSWAFYFAGAAAAFLVPFRYAYVFNVFQEIKNHEAAAVPALQTPAEQGRSA